MADNAEGKDGGAEMKSLSRKKLMSKGKLQSKMSLKKIGHESQTFSESDSSLVNKRQSDFDRVLKGPRYQNTYRLDSKFPFKPGEVHRILEHIVKRETTDYPYYDSNAMPKLAQIISGEVRTSIRNLNYDRYKLCVLVYIGENKLQGFQASFRALWDSERDSWATYYYHCRTYFISCTCFGFYHD